MAAEKAPMVLGYIQQVKVPSRHIMPIVYFFFMDGCYAQAVMGETMAACSKKVSTLALNALENCI